MGIFERMHIGLVTVAVFADERTLYTAGSDSVICCWSVSTGRQLSFNLFSVLRGHLDTVLSLAVSRSYSIIVSGGSVRYFILFFCY